MKKKPQRTPSFYAKFAKKKLCDLCDSCTTFAVKKIKYEMDYVCLGIYQIRVDGNF